MNEVVIVDREGNQHRLAMDPARTLMELLRDADLGVAAICGGTLSCGTCHVYIDNQATAGLTGPSEDESALTEGLNHHVHGRSRLSCQISLGSFDGPLGVTIAPEE